ncbi:6-hydroxymethylpterin diphosphokinase MptE-like protein [Clostridium sp. UBA1056]|uniref:motility associated factor glycosyltransferase family protein n=1 Tax=unclassified Clostridium TaxID=2614128 RepID=UPI0032177DCC
MSEKNEYELRLVKSKDNYNTYEIIRGNSTIVLGSKYNYERTMEQLFSKLQDINENTVIIIYGLDSGEYLEKLSKLVTYNNKVLVIEPIESIAKKYKDRKYKNLNIVSIRDIDKYINRNLIDLNNINNIIFHCFGNYGRAFKDEYEVFVKELNELTVNIKLNINTINKLKKESTFNIINNLIEINNSYNFKDWEGIYRGATALVISAGPSLDKNINDLLKYKDKLDNCVIIAGNRTVKPLIENGIIPDFVCAIDPQEVVYDMVKDYLSYKIPLVYTENTNNKLIKLTEGNRFFGSNGLALLLGDRILNKLSQFYSGGSVAHLQTNVAVKLGCESIIFLGQDLAYTFDKSHSNSTENKIDLKPTKASTFYVKDVYDKDILTEFSLNHFRIYLEDYIKQVKGIKDIQFINSSYGANINGTVFKELEEVFEENNFMKISKVKLPKDSEKMSFNFNKFKEEFKCKMKEFILDIDKSIYKCEKNLSLSSEKKIKENLLFIKKVNERINGYKELFIFDYFISGFLINADSYFEFSVEDSRDSLNYAKKVSCGYKEYLKELKKILEEITTSLDESSINI